MRKVLLIYLLWVLQISVSGAAENITSDAKALVKNLFPGFNIDDVRAAPIAGFLEVTINNQVLYLAEDGKFMFLGDLVDMTRRVNLSEQRRAEMTAGLLDGVGLNKMIVIGAKEATRYVTVFTDVDCPYCAKFHLDVPKLNEAGLQVRYLLYPRAGVGSKSYQRAISVWCAKDQIQAIGVAKAGGSLPRKQCDHPVNQHIELGRQVGIKGTPLIVLDDGRLIPGYVRADRLLARLEMTARAN